MTLLFIYDCQNVKLMYKSTAELPLGHTFFNGTNGRPTFCFFVCLFINYFKFDRAYCFSLKILSVEIAVVDVFCTSKNFALKLKKNQHLGTIGKLL